MNKSVIAVAIIVVVLVGGYFLSVPKTPNQQTVRPPPVTQPPAPEEKVVTYTDSGYSPNILTVKKGETITFKNQSLQSMWTASAVHPTHRLYPTTGGCSGSTFDTCQGVQPGNSWSFTFDIAGTWKYHNHLDPGKTGTITVE